MFSKSSGRYRGIGVLSTRETKKRLVNCGILIVALGLGLMFLAIYDDHTSPETIYGKKGYTLMTAQRAKSDKGIKDSGPHNIPGATTFLPAGHHYYEANFDEKEGAEFLTTLDQKQSAPGPITKIEWFGASVTVTFENGCEVTRTWDVSRNPGHISPMHDIGKECDKDKLPPYS